MWYNHKNISRNYLQKISLTEASHCQRFISNYFAEFLNALFWRFTQNFFFQFSKIVSILCVTNRLKNCAQNHFGEKSLLTHITKIWQICQFLLENPQKTFLLIKDLKNHKLRYNPPPCFSFFDGPAASKSAPCFIARDNQCTCYFYFIERPIRKYISKDPFVKENLKWHRRVLVDHPPGFLSFHKYRDPWYI